jgi:type II secretory ATPase GspE/PulE/Tfp pilus assembly ATPase PilB-like protein
MPTFKFEAMDTAGGEVKDTVEAATEEEAQQKIRQMGYFVTRLTKVAAKKAGAARPAPQGKEESITDIISSLADDLPRQSENSIDLVSLMEIQDAAPVRKLVNMVILLALKDKASDIHWA